MNPLGLEMDIGNSTVKWRVMDGAKRLWGGRTTNSSAELEVLFAELLKQQLAEVRIASVATLERDQYLLELLRQTGLPVKVAQSQADCAGVHNSYSDVARMGVDRWLAMVAAFGRCQGACVVVDAGTALTIDILDVGGVHQGGYIIPGVALSVRALAQHTGRVRFYGDDKASLEPGTDTEGCVHHGKWLAQYGAVLAAINQAEALHGGPCDIFVTGGDAPILLELAGRQAATWQYCEDLVLDGLTPVLAASQ